MFQLSFNYNEKFVAIQHLIVSRDHPLRTLLIAPITDSKHVLTSDGQKLPPWLKFRELHNFYISLIGFDVPITSQNTAVHHFCVTNLQSSSRRQISLKLTCGGCVCRSIVNDIREPFFDPPWTGVCKDKLISGIFHCFMSWET